MIKKGYRIDKELILDYIQEHGLTIEEFTKLCNISEDTMQKILANDGEFPAVELMMIAFTIGVEPRDMFY